MVARRSLVLVSLAFLFGCKSTSPASPDSGPLEDAPRSDAPVAPADPACLVGSAAAAPWARCFGGEIGTVVNDADWDGSGGAWITGTTNGARAGALELVALGVTDAFLVRFDVQGTAVVARTFGGPFVGGSGEEDSGQALAAMPGGDVIVGGTFGGDAEFGEGIVVAGDQDVFHADRREIYFARFAADGRTLWAERATDSRDRDDVLALASDGAGGFYATGFVGLGYLGGAPQTGAFLVHRDAARAQAWMIGSTPEVPFKTAGAVVLPSGALLWSGVEDAMDITLQGHAMPHGGFLAVVGADGTMQHVEPGGRILGWNGTASRALVQLENAVYHAPDPLRPHALVGIAADGTVSTTQPLGPGAATLADGELFHADTRGAVGTDGDAYVAVSASGRITLASGVEVDAGDGIGALLVRYLADGTYVAHLGPLADVRIADVLVDDATGEIVIVGDHRSDAFEIFGQPIARIGTESRYPDAFVARGRLE